MFLISIPQLDLFGPEKRQISRQVVVMSPIVIVIMVLIYGGQNPKISLSVVTDTARKVSKYGIFSGPYFPVFRLNTDWIRIQPEYGKTRTRKNSVFGHFSRSVSYGHNKLFWRISLYNYQFDREVYVPMRVLFLIEDFFKKLHEADLLLIQNMLFVLTFANSCF